VRPVREDGDDRSLHAANPVIRSILVLKPTFPRTPGSKNETCTFFQSSLYIAPFHCSRWLKNSVFRTPAEVPQYLLALPYASII